VGLKEYLFLFGLPVICMLIATFTRWQALGGFLFAVALVWVLFWDGCAHIAAGIGSATSGAGSTLTEDFDHAIIVAVIGGVVWAVFLILRNVVTQKEKKRKAIIIVPIVLIVAGTILYFSLWLVRRFSQIH
jgi:hypothetical protein